MQTKQMTDMLAVVEQYLSITQMTSFLFGHSVVMGVARKLNGLEELLKRLCTGCSISF